MATIRDVGKAAGVSPTTVSRVLNDKDTDHVSKATRKRVLKAADRLNYRPSAAARALVAGRTHTIAVHSSAVVYTSFFTRLTQEIQRVVGDRGYHLMLVPGDHEDDLAELLRERRVDAVIWARYPVEHAERLRDAVTAPHQRVIGIGSIHDAPPTGCCVAWWDDAAGTRRAIEHLADLGHERVGFLAGSRKNLELWPNMRQAFEDTCSERGLKGTTVYADEDEHPYATGVEMAAKIVEMPSRPTGVLGLNDDYALGILNGLFEAGIDVPSEISVCGYNDLPVASYTRPSLTTVVAPYIEATQYIVPALIDILEDPSGAETPELCSKEFKTGLAVRETTGPPPG